MSPSRRAVDLARIPAAPCGQRLADRGATPGPRSLAAEILADPAGGGEGRGGGAGA